MIRLVLILYQVSVISSQIPKYTYNTEDSTVQNIIYDDSNKRVFVGGTNQILRLSVCSYFYSQAINCYSSHVHFD